MGPFDRSMVTNVIVAHDRREKTNRRRQTACLRTAIYDHTRKMKSKKSNKTCNLDLLRAETPSRNTNRLPSLIDLDFVSPENHWQLNAVSENIDILDCLSTSRTRVDEIGDPLVSKATRCGLR
jgi:hypothetical protein